MHKGDPFGPVPPLREPVLAYVSRVRYRGMLNLGSRRIRFSILIIANSPAIDVLVGSRDPWAPPPASQAARVFLIAALSQQRAGQPAHNTRTGTIESMARSCAGMARCE